MTVYFTGHRQLEITGGRIMEQTAVDLVIFDGEGNEMARFDLGEVVHVRYPQRGIDGRVQRYLNLEVLPA